MRALRFGATSVAALMAFALFGSVQASDDTQRAYEAALRCYVANGHVYDSFTKSGDTANAQLFNAKAKRAFDLAYSYGGMLHLSQQQVSTDLDAATDAELRKLMTDGGYLTTVAKDCKYWGMM